MSEEIKRLKDYIEALSKEDYDEWFANIEEEEKQLKLLKSILDLKILI